MTPLRVKRLLSSGGGSGINVGHFGVTVRFTAAAALRTAVGSTNRSGASKLYRSEKCFSVSQDGGQHHNTAAASSARTFTAVWAHHCSAGTATAVHSSLPPPCSFKWPSPTIYNVIQPLCDTTLTNNWWRRCLLP